MQEEITLIEKDMIKSDAIFRVKRFAYVIRGSQKIKTASF